MFTLDSTFEGVTSNMVDGPGKVSKRKRVKSPLRYPGGKSRAVNTILEMLPHGLESIASPFFGGGSVELVCASELGMKVYGYDAFSPVCAFWQALLTNRTKLVDEVRKYYPLTKTRQALKKPKENVYENRKLTQQELNQKWKLVKQ